MLVSFLGSLNNDRDWQREASHRACTKARDRVARRSLKDLSIFVVEGVDAFRCALRPQVMSSDQASPVAGLPQP